MNRHRLSQLAHQLTPPSPPTDRLVLDPNADSFPKRSELPTTPSEGPEGAAWVWGENDDLGRLNLLTPARTLAATRELIKTGQTIPLDLPLHEPSPPLFGRQAPAHTLHDLHHGLAYDDHLTINTQSGTQWDGFGHFSHLATGRFYNSHVPTAEGVSGVLAWQQHGITARALVLDWAAWAQKEGKEFDVATSHKIPLADLVAVGKSQGIDIRPASAGGDVPPGCILLIRSGFVAADRSYTPDQRERLHARPQDFPRTENRWIGVEQSEDMADWIHDCWFAAVAGDAPAFESWPSEEGWWFHERLLALWGVPIGEMWDLERLSKVCKEEKRWWCVVNSAPLGLRGGVAALPNAVAIM